MHMKTQMARLTAISAIFVGSAASARQPGPVTPTSVTYTINSVSLIDAGGQYHTLTQTPFSYAFRRADPDLAQAPLANVDIELGRYTAANVCFSTAVQMVFDGIRYDGRDGTLIQHGDLVYSVGSD